MGNVFGKGSNTTTSTQTSAAAPQLSGAITQSQNVAANNPFQAYGGEFAAPINQQQYSGIGNINQNAQFALPYVNQALQLQSNAANPLTAQQIQNYQNPYTQNVVNAAEGQFDLMNKTALENIRGNAAAQGALGGDRNAVAQSAYYGAVLPGQEATVAGLYNQSYNQALQTAGQQYQQNPQQAAFGLTSSGVAGQNAGLSGATAQVGAGSLEQQTQQAQDAALYNQFLMQQAFPYQQQGWLNSQISSLGSGMGGTSSTTAPPPNPLTQILGLGLAGAGVAGGLGWKPFANRGGRIKGYDDGGGVGSTPYANIKGYIPSSTAFHGSFSLPAIPKAIDPNADTIKNAEQFGMQSLFRNNRDATPARPVYSPGTLGGTAGPLYTNENGGLYADGGSVIDAVRDPNGIYVPRGYADGGMSFTDRWNGLNDDPHQPLPEAPADVYLNERETQNLGLGRPVNWGAPDTTPASPAIPSMPSAPQPRPSTEDAAIPENATPTAGGALDLGPAIPSSASTSPGTWDKGGTGWQGLMAAGLGMMASRSPFLGVGIGEGGLQGLQTFAQQRKQEIDVEREAKKLAQQADQFQKSLAQQKEMHMTATPYQQAELALKQRQQRIAELQPVTVTDPVTGMPHTMARDPDTGQLRPIDPATGQLLRTNPLQTAPTSPTQPANPLLQNRGAREIPVSWDVDQGMEYLARPTASETQSRARDVHPEVLEGIPEGMANRVKAMAEGREPYPTGAAQRMPQNIAAMELLRRYAPNYTAQDYQTFLATRRDFTSGPTSKNITALNTVMQHVKELDNAASALNNWHSGLGAKPLNAVTEGIRDFNQDKRLTGFNTAANAVANELERAFRGNTTAISGIEEWRKGLNPAMSPEQWEEARTRLMKLIGGRLESVTDQYNRGMRSARDPMEMLSPGAAAAYKELLHPGAQSSSQQRQVGQIVTTPKGVFRWNGSGWEPVQ